MNGVVVWLCELSGRNEVLVKVGSETSRLRFGHKKLWHLRDYLLYDSVNR